MQRGSLSLDTNPSSAFAERPSVGTSSSVPVRPGASSATPDVTTVQTIKAGAEDYLVKPITSQRLLEAIEKALTHHKLLRGSRNKLDALRSQIGLLTPRERQVFELVVRGKINKQIAVQLGATERTIKAHRHKVMEKMQVQSLAELVSIAERVGILAAVN